jgi:hypothetical protein
VGYWKNVNGNGEVEVGDGEVGEGEVSVCKIYSVGV